MTNMANVKPATILITRTFLHSIILVSPSHPAHVVQGHEQNGHCESGLGGSAFRYSQHS